MSQYIMKVRVEKGRELLINTPMTIEEIANYVGFKTTRLFFKMF